MKLFHYMDADDEAKLKQIIAEMVETECCKLSELIKRENKREKSAKYVSTAEAVKILGISRQTLTHWEKGLIGGINLSGLVKKEGGRKLYDIESIQKLCADRKARQERWGMQRHRK